VDGRASNASTVWRQVATATGGYGRRTRKTLSLRALRFFYPQISRESLKENLAVGDTNGAIEAFYQATKAD
jgi:hypothetical protein